MHVYEALWSRETNRYDRKNNQTICSMPFLSTYSAYEMDKRLGFSCRCISITAFARAYQRATKVRRFLVYQSYLWCALFEHVRKKVIEIQQEEKSTQFSPLYVEIVLRKGIKQTIRCFTR